MMGTPLQRRILEFAFISEMEWKKGDATLFLGRKTHLNRLTKPSSGRAIRLRAADGCR